MAPTAFPTYTHDPFPHHFPSCPNQEIRQFHIPSRRLNDLTTSRPIHIPVLIPIPIPMHHPSARPKTKPACGGRDRTSCVFFLAADRINSVVGGVLVAANSGRVPADSMVRKHDIWQPLKVLVVNVVYVGHLCKPNKNLSFRL